MGGRYRPSLHAEQWITLLHYGGTCMDHLPLLESRHAEQLGPVRDTLARLQVVYAQQAGGAAPEGGPQEPAQPAEPEQPEGPGPAQSSGRLWIPGQ